MCGIAGLVSLSGQDLTEVDAALVSTMCDVQVHRGPDDCGVTALGRAVLGSNRLSIIDLSQAGHMPMSDPRTGRWITYNGEVYNFAELRRELETHGHQFRSHTDTEVVLHAYEEWGVAALDRLVGMFAFAIYDPAADAMILVRDRYGKKPLYYARRKDQLLFASEIKTLARALGDLKPNQRRLTEWSLYRNVDFGSTETLFDGVSILPAGHLLEVSRGQVQAPSPYYVLERHVDREAYERYGGMAPEAIGSEIEALVRAGIDARLVSDVPVGTLCSGGIDSSLITALAAEGRKDLLAFNVSVKGQGAEDESRFARQVTDRLGIQLLTLEADGASFRHNLVRAIYANDQPLTHPNSVYFLLISEFARAHGVKVLLSGEAADELFGGYAHRYRRLRQYRRIRGLLSRLPAKARRGIALAGYALENVPATEFTGYEGLLAHATAFIDRYSRAELHERCERAFGFVADELDRGVLASMLADLTNFLGPLLRRLDRMSMAASVECRAPYLDHRLVHAAINLPIEYRLRGKTDKWGLKAVAKRHLPRAIAQRKKVSFPLPLVDYLAPFSSVDFFAQGFCVDYLGMNPRGITWPIVRWRENVNGFFNLLSLEIWGRIYFLGQSVADVNRELAKANTGTVRSN